MVHTVALLHKIFMESFIFGKEIGNYRRVHADEEFDSRAMREKNDRLLLFSAFVDFSWI